MTAAMATVVDSMATKRLEADLALSSGAISSHVDDLFSETTLLPALTTFCKIDKS